jgi:SAM-dependent methyltransferase
MAQEDHRTSSLAHNPGNYRLRRGGLRQELRSIARPLKKGDARGLANALACSSANLWNHYARSRAGARFLCSCCGEKAYAFVSLADHWHASWNAACPTCDSRSRHRGLALVIRRLLDEREDLARVLHFAPEMVLTQVLGTFDRLHYQTTDMDDIGSDLPNEDIQKLSFADGDYDLVLCSHVLEHVPDDGAAMGELARILSPHGLALISVPCDWRRAKTKSFRRIRSEGHFRHYGRDLADRLSQSFKSVQVLDMHEIDAAPGGLSYGIRRGDILLLCSKRDCSGIDVLSSTDADGQTG